MTTKERFEQLMARHNVSAPRAHSDLEHRLQAACVQWFALAHPALRHNLFAVPNGGRRDATTGARLKAEGVLAGVADLILLRHKDIYGALLLELKTATGRQSKAQRDWQRAIERDGYKYVIVRCIDDFIREVEQYLSPATTTPQPC